MYVTVLYYYILSYHARGPFQGLLGSAVLPCLAWPSVSISPTPRYGSYVRMCVCIYIYIYIGPGMCICLCNTALGEHQQFLHHSCDYTGHS